MHSTAPVGTEQLALSSSLAVAPKPSAPAAINPLIKAGTTGAGRLVCRWRRCTRSSEASQSQLLPRYAVGGGNVLATLCDLTIAGESAQFGQVGPKVGSVDPGFGTAYLARVVGEKKAREIWYLCRRYSAQEALAMGLINKVVPDDQLDAEVAAWCREILERSPTAIAVAKRSFNADSDNIAGIAAMGLQALKLYYETEESKEGVRAFNEKRKPDFRRFTK